ncbi:uncharacterized protein BJ212DRAFT_1482891 [Suillus subaureus]|uniref:Uncharacterized protein n=1 Tax=Suillus subaureus TaxID=48587 RepID=A0A9P7E777_9AGAM|nr:uncharacterized protein BJ212DRAFT_1482891 [Suillus subaureus]KAG1812824.1 hypothetical protein BJ212DRAFT_1482891 [Suillus subaureus]
MTMSSPQPPDHSLPSPFDDKTAEETYTTHDAAPRATSPAHAVDPFAAADLAPNPSRTHLYLSALSDYPAPPPTHCEGSFNA